MLVAACLVCALSYPTASAIAQEATAPASTAPPTIPPTVRGLLVPIRETVLSAEIPGLLKAVSVMDGQRVAQGEEIAALDCRTHQLQRDRHAAEIRRAEKTLSVQRQLSGLNSGSALDAATARARLDVARVDAALTANTIEHCVIAAPFGGRIEQVKVDAHQYVTDEQSIVAIYDNNALEVEVIVPSHWLAWLRPGSPFNLDVEEIHHTFPGTVTRLGARIDPASQSLKIVGTLSPAPLPEAGLLPGMSGQVRFSGP